MNKQSIQTIRLLLIEAETKLEALQCRMDHMLNECATEDQLRPYVKQWESLMDYVNQLKREVQS